MANITIPDIDDDLRERLKERAVEHGRSVEVEAREILEDALVGTQRAVVPDNLYDAIRAIVEPFGGFELEPFPRQSLREPPKLDWHMIPKNCRLFMRKLKEYRERCRFNVIEKRYKLA